MSLKSKLKNGAVVECRNGHRFIKIDKTLLDECGEFMDLDSYTDELLKPYSLTGYSWDIVKINNNVCNNNGYCNIALQEVHENKWTWKRPKEILDEKEKEYLSAVIKPFRNKVKYITKKNFIGDDKYYIRIDLNYDLVDLPYFKSNKMYKNMELNKKYTLAELGL